MKAMILAAGVGSRLKPLTNQKPKALLEIHGKTLLEFQIRKLMYFGFRDIIINVHHFADKIVKFLEQNNNFDLNISFSDEQENLLDTGGGIKNATWFFENTDFFLIQNVDIITDLDISMFVNAFRKKNADVLLAVKDRDSSRKLLFDKEQHLKAWKNNKTGEKKFVDLAKEEVDLWEFAFSGMHLISSSLTNEFPETDRFSIIQTYLDWARQYKIMAYLQEKDLWWDVGKIDQIEGFRQNAEMKKIINQY